MVAAPAPLDGWQLFVQLVGGLALFLFGMELMGSALKAVAGDRLKFLLGRLTTNRFLSVVTGALITAIVQSSSVTTVLVVGFVSAELMTMVQSIGVIMGANIGTTITAQLIAFKVSEIALLPVALGFVVATFPKSPRLRDHGRGLLGLGLVFYGMGVMSQGMAPLRTHEPFLDLLVSLESPGIGILAGTIFTALVQSSAATTGVVIAMSAQGLLSLPAGIALIFGANIGTCITALLAAIGKPREAVRVAFVHVLFNVIGVLIWLPLIGFLADLVVRISPAGDGGVTPRQIANAHTVFNVANTSVLIWFAAPLGRLVRAIVPDRASDEEMLRRAGARYLDRNLIRTPVVALSTARMEILRLGDEVRGMLEQTLPTVLGGTREELERIAALDDRVDLLHGQIVDYLGAISEGNLTEAQTEELIQLLSIANHLEAIGDDMETNLVFLGSKRIRAGIRISAETRADLDQLHKLLLAAFDSALVASTQQNETAAMRVFDLKGEIQALSASAAVHQSRRLTQPDPDRLRAYALEVDLFEGWKQIYSYCKRMARIEV